MLHTRPVASTTRTEDTLIKRRLLGCLPATRFEMETLSRLADICTTRALPTAAVECKRRPRLLINPDFVAKHCQRDEHLFLLVMHELWHVMLAHTRMYPRMTEAQNIAFDAIINAGLMREFHKPEYRGFFESINPADQFPSCLLRPPEGWPHAPQYPENVGPPGTKAILQRLYPQGNYHNHNGVLYEEVLNLLLKSGYLGKAMLLGNHDSTPVHDPYMKEIMKQISGNWPPMNMGRGAGGALAGRTFQMQPAAEAARRAFSQILRQCLTPRPGRQRRRAKVQVPAEGGLGVLPNARDRLNPAKRLLGAPSTLYAQEANIKARIPEKPSRSFVYLDVSGSMNFVLPRLLDLILPYVAQKHAEVYQFSTHVKELGFNELRQGQLSTTGGTNINCVLEHVLGVTPKVNRVLILTDGAVGSPLPHLTDQLLAQNIKVYVVMPHNCKLDEGTQVVTTSITSLPPIQ